MPLKALFAPLLPLFATVPLMAGQDGGQQASEVDVLAINLDPASRMTVPVHLADKGPFRFLIDTGAQNTVISTALAQKLALRPTNQARLVSIAGTETVDTVELDQVDLGTRSYYGLLAPLLDYNDIGADGIIGLDGLQGQRVLIDFRKKTVAVSDAKKLGGNRGFEIVVTAKRRSGQLIMTNAIIDGVRTEVVIDTGAEYSIGNRALQRAMAKRSMQGTTTLHSVTGHQISADLGLGRKLDLQQIGFNNVVIAYADSPAFAALRLDQKPALFLGMRDIRGLDRLAIDFQARKVYFDLPAGTF